MVTVFVLNLPILGDVTGDQERQKSGTKLGIPARSRIPPSPSGEQTPQITHFLGTACAFIFAELPPTLKTLTFFSLDLFNLK